jgi:tRNA(Ile)-lysidine synthase
MIDAGRILQALKTTDREDLPDSILSLHVDHDLQADAEKMAEAARTSARTYETSRHIELRVPWDDPPFPMRPCAQSGDAIESVARTARYRLMVDAMVRERVYVLATGHHADDQVETVLMRLGSGSSTLGLGGMRPLRRVGMALGKGQDDFGWFGHEGLDRWIVRPLLDVPKVCFWVFFFGRGRFTLKTLVLGQDPCDLRVAWYSICARPNKLPA